MKERRTKVHVKVDNDDNVLEIIVGPDVILPDREHKAKVTWREVGHHEYCALLQVAPDKFKVRKAKGKNGKPSIEPKDTHEIRDRKLIRKKDKDR